jgi:FkbM family methyltransferase
MLTETEFNTLIENALQYNVLNNHLVDEFLSPECFVKKYIVGKNEDSSNILKSIKIDGIIDDFSSDIEWNGVSIVKSSIVSPDSIVLHCSTSVSPIEVLNKLSSCGITNIICLAELLISDKYVGPLPIFVIEMRKEWNLNKLKWYNLYSNLVDDVSRSILIDLIRFRLTANIEYMKEFSVRLEDQYLEEFMDYQNEVFVDIGGFDGDTTELFCTKYPNYKKVYLFEPSSTNMGKAKSRLSKFKNITFIPYGLSDRKEELYFNSENGSSSAISQEGTIKIVTTTLDDEINEKLTFMKMDIEGWELNALRGSLNHLLNDHPKLAIAVYHRAVDFISIPDFILSVNNDYDLYLRHYTSGWSESVMFFKPKKSV